MSKTVIYQLTFSVSICSLTRGLSVFFIEESVFSVKGAVSFYASRINCNCRNCSYFETFIFLFRTLTFTANLLLKVMWKLKTLISAHYNVTKLFLHIILHKYLLTHYTLQSNCKINKKNLISEFSSYAKNYLTKHP